MEDERFLVSGSVYHVSRIMAEYLVFTHESVMCQGLPGVQLPDGSKKFSAWRPKIATLEKKTPMDFYAFVVSHCISLIILYS